MKASSLLTGLPCEMQSDPMSGISFYGHDPACGDYAVSRSLFDELADNERDRRRLGGVVAGLRARGERRPIGILGPSSRMVFPNADKWSFYSSAELLRLFPGPLELLTESLYNLSFRISHPSEPIRLKDSDAWTLYSYDHDSAAYVLDQMVDLGYVKKKTSSGSRELGGQEYRVLSEGWKKLVERQSQPAPTSNQAFVAMWFQPSMQAIYDEGIRPAIEANHFSSVRIDAKEHNNKICDEIVAEIRRSRFVVADFSGNRGGVYFEAGFAMGLKLPVIFTVQKKALKKVHFDTRQYNHLVYETPAELREKLANRIRATIDGTQVPMTLAADQRVGGDAGKP